MAAAAAEPERQQLCDEASDLGPEFNHVHDIWLWTSWAQIREELVRYLENPADFFRQLGVRRQFMWLIRWFASGPAYSLWQSSCPLGILSLRLFTVLLCNDADRCIQMRDTPLGTEILDMPFADVAASGWPVFNMLGRLSEEAKRISFPLYNPCDERDDDVSDAFRRELEAALSKDACPPPAARALRQLRSSTDAGCAFGVAAAHFSLADLLENCRDGEGEGELREAGLDGGGARRWLLDNGQLQLRSWPPLRASLYDLVTTKWPVWRSLERLASPPAAYAHGGSEAHVRNVEVVFCGAGWRGLEADLSAFADEHGWRLHFLRADAAACPGFYLEVSRAVLDASLLLMLSPLLWAWDADARTSLVTIADIVAAEAAIDVAGFTTLDKERRWGMNVWQLHRGDWRLKYAAYPTGYRSSTGDRCFTGDATSATRIFRRASRWREAVLRTGTSGDALEDPLSWFVDLDLEIRQAGLGVHTCISQPILEDSYLEAATLTPTLARKYGVEVAHFSASNRAERCLGPEDWPKMRTAAAGVLPPCLEREARLALRFASQWSASARQSLHVTASPRNQALLLTHGGFLLQPGGDAREVALEVLACCDPRRGGGPRCQLPQAAELAAAPPGLTWQADARRVTLASARLNVTVLELRACAAPASSPSHAFRVPGVGDLEVLSPEPPEPTAVPAHIRVEALLCCQDPALEGEVRRSLEALGWAHRSLLADASECLPFLQRAAEATPDGSVVVLLSPLLWAWEPRAAGALALGVRRLMSRGQESVLGFPTLDRSLVWQAGVRRIRHQYWKLVYALPPRPQAQAEECSRGSAGSGTRVFRSAFVLKTLLRDLEPDPDNPLNWLVDLDLGLNAAQVSVLTCASWPISEADYLGHVGLTARLSEAHQIEAARFLHRHAERCLAGANWFQVTQKGLVAPWCFRRDVIEAFRGVTRWWTSVNPGRNFASPEEGTFLALFRNGAAGMLPWDSDFDMKLYSEDNLTIQEFMNQTKGEGFQRMEIEAYAYDGCGQDSYVLLRRPNITHHIGDVYVKGGERRSHHPWRADFFGVEVALSPEHFDHIFFNRYRTPVRKLFGDGLPLHCFVWGHNACLPDCRDEAAPCEFEDNFVHVERFEIEPDLVAA